MKEVKISEVSSLQILITWSMSQCTREQSNQKCVYNVGFQYCNASLMLNIFSPLYRRKNWTKRFQSQKRDILKDKSIAQNKLKQRFMCSIVIITQQVCNFNWEFYIYQSLSSNFPGILGTLQLSLYHHCDASWSGVYCLYL